MNIPIAFDNTMIEGFNVCPRKYYWSHVQSWQPATPAIPLIFGQAIHSALEMWYITGDRAKALATFKEGMIEAAGYEDDKRNIPNGVAILSGYFSQYPVETFTPLVGENHRCEISFNFPLNMDSISYCGRIDMAVKSNYGILYIDHKTTSMLGSQYFYMIKPNRQFAGYHYALREFFPEVYGGLINALFVGKPKALTKTQEKEIAAAEFMNDYERAANLRATYSGNTRFAREITTRTDSELEHWLADTKQFVANIIAEYERDEWPQFSHSCTYYGICPYHALCSQPRHFKDVKVNEVQYVKRVWSPLERNELI